MIFIAEIGMNYNGNFNLCYELIKQAKYSGADIAKFQLGWRDKPGEINQLDFKKVSQLRSCFLSAFLLPSKWPRDTVSMQ